MAPTRVAAAAAAAAAATDDDDDGRLTRDDAQASPGKRNKSNERVRGLQRLKTGRKTGAYMKQTHDLINDASRLDDETADRQSVTSSSARSRQQLRRSPPALVTLITPLGLVIRRCPAPTQTNSSFSCQRIVSCDSITLRASRRDFSVGKHFNVMRRRQYHDNAKTRILLMPAKYIGAHPIAGVDCVSFFNDALCSLRVMDAP
jgi:hypothetical protein